MPSPQPSIYSKIRIKHAHRRVRPWVDHHFRTKSLTKIETFYRDRFYELDRWYKARIERPLLYPTFHRIDPDKFQKSLKERIEEKRLSVDPILNAKVDIGFAFSENSPIAAAKAVRSKEADAELERLARHRKLVVDLEELQSDEQTVAGVEPKLVKSIAEHYGIFRDLFHADAHFHPTVPLRIDYPFPECKSGADRVLRIYFGNTVDPKEAKLPPEVWFPSVTDGDSSLWTLLMVNPDGNLYEENADVLHWLIINIPGNKVNEGRTLCEYLQPLPFKGTGWHRFVFILFKQSENLPDRIENFAVSTRPDSFAKRTFRTPKFYKEFENVLTPAGLAFFQAEWDSSCQDCLHKQFDMAQPIFQYEWPEIYKPPQVISKKYQPFNIYLDMYRDEKDIQKEIFEKRLKLVSPFKPMEKWPKYPNIFWYEDQISNPSWLAKEKERERLGLGKYRGIYENHLTP